MNSDSQASTSSTDSESDVKEIEAMLYSQIHHCVQLSSDDEIKQTTNKENIQHAANEEVIVLSSDDECEILDSSGDVSKYNYHGLKKNNTKRCMTNGMGHKISKRSVVSNEEKPIELKNTSTTTNSTSSLNSSATCLANLYIHIDGDGAQMDAEEIDVGSDTEILSVSSVDYDAESVRKGKVVTSPKKRQNTTNVRHTIDDEDGIMEIPVPVRKGEDWFICAGDRFSKTPDRRRDFHRRSLHIICHNCNQRGHITKTCPSPMKKIRCYICGDLGHHGDRCFRAMCSVCWETGHSSTFCDQRKKMSYKRCNICQVLGHPDENCPDSWRRYHLTTEPGNCVTTTSLLKSRKTISCCNCGQKGHFVHECQGKRMDIFVLPNRPDVVTYALLPIPSKSQTRQQYSSNNISGKADKAFGKFKQWKRNFKQDTMQVVSSIKQGVHKRFGLGNNFKPKFKRKGFPSQGTSGYSVEQSQSIQQLTNARKKKKLFWKNMAKQNNFNWQN